ncbi:MAG: hypothetical protein ACOYEV_15575 [Candidatus Nanopelagicales bacterium]
MRIPGRPRRLAVPSGLLPGERVLAIAQLGGSEHSGALGGTGQVVATNWALLLPVSGGAESAERVEWDRITAGNWDDGALDVRYQAAAGPQSQRLVLPEPGELPAVVRERITHTVVATRRRQLIDESGRTTQVLIAARRSPRSDQISWTVAFQDPRVGADPAWRTAADAAIAQLRAQLGL